MKTIHLLFLSLTMLVLSVETQARPHMVNFDTIYAHADFCDRVEIVNYDTALSVLSVKSNLDSLTYSFSIGYFNTNDFSSNKKEYLLIRGDGIIILGISQGGKWVFNKIQSRLDGSCFISTSNPIAEIENKNDQLSGKISFPKKYFKLKTPFASLSQEEIENNPLLYCKANTNTIVFDSVNNRYFNDTIYVKKVMINPKHMVLMFNITRTINSSQDCYEYLPAILNALKLPSEKILEGCERSTEELGYGESAFSYSNVNYKLIIYSMYRPIRNEDYSSLDIYLK